MSEQPLSDTELAELHALALLHAPPVDNDHVVDGCEKFDVPAVPRMGPSGAANIRAFLEAKQAEADAKAAAG
jgi:hypothetical protein